MHPEMKKILHWAIGGGFVALAVDWMVLGGEPMGTRATVGFLCYGAGFVTGGLLAANFSKDHDEASTPAHDQPHAPAASPEPQQPSGH